MSKVKNKKRVPTYNFTLANIQSMVDTKVAAQREIITSEAIRIVSSILFVTLHDEFGFGKKRIQRLMERLHYNYECIDEGIVDVEDFYKVCIEELEVEMDDNR